MNILVNNNMDTQKSKFQNLNVRKCYRKTTNIQNLSILDKIISNIKNKSFTRFQRKNNILKIINESGKC